MSSAPNAHDDPSHAHVFTGEPIQELPADEPRTPVWLPLVGIALFTAAAVYVLAGRTTLPADGAKPDAAAHAAVAPTAAQPRADAVRTPPPGAVPAGAAPAPTIRTLSAEQIARARQANPQPAPAH
jgi:hypothetical protein